MYNDKKDGFSLKDVAIQVLIIVLFVFILIWLFPTKSYVDKLASNSTNSGSISDISDQYITNAVFIENMKTLRETAKDYYSLEKMPTEIGNDHKVGITLKEMLEKKLILPLMDSEGKSCHATDSYVEVVKTSSKEYTMTINLTCGEMSDYIIIYLGCYDYCQDNVCEKEDTSTLKPTVNPPKPTPTPTPTPNPTPDPEPTPEPEKHYCEYINDKYYGKNGNEVDKATYEAECKEPEPEKHYCEYINDKYYGKNGNEVDKATYEAECKEPEPEKHYCEYINGKYYGKNGNEVDKATYEAECTTPKPTPIYEYEYGKDGVWNFPDEWSAWQTTPVVASSTRKVETQQRKVTNTYQDYQPIQKEDGYYKCPSSRYELIERNGTCVLYEKESMEQNVSTTPGTPLYSAPTCPSGYSMVNGYCTAYASKASTNETPKPTTITNPIVTGSTSRTYTKDFETRMEGSNSSTITYKYIGKHSVPTCPTGCYKTMYSYQVTETTPGTTKCTTGTLSNGKCVSQGVCPAGTTDTGRGTCVQYVCPPTYKEDASGRCYTTTTSIKGSIIDYTCPSGYNYSSSRRACVKTTYECPRGTQQIGNACYSTITKKATYVEGKTSCPSGYSYSGDGKTCSKTIYSNTYVKEYRYKDAIYTPGSTIWSRNPNDQELINKGFKRTSTPPREVKTDSN